MKRFPIAVLLLALVILLPTLTFRLAVDQAVFAHMGAQLLRGHLPYLATWESDYPGMMLLHGFEILIFGKSIVMFRVFDLLFQLAIVLLVYRITVTVGSRAGGLFAAGLYCFIYQSYGPWNTAQREGFATLFALWGFWLYLTRERRPAARTALGIGLGLGLSVLIKPTMLALAGFYVPLVPLVRRPHWKWVAIGFAGLVFPAAAFTLWYAAIGGLRDLYEATIAYQSIYTARFRGTDSLIVHWLKNGLRLGRQTIAVGLAYLPFLAVGPLRRERLMLYFAYLGTVAAVVVQGTFAGYHYLPGLAVGAILIGSAVAILVDFARRRWPTLVAGQRDVMLAGLVLAALAPFYVKRDAWARLVRLDFLRPPVPGEFTNGTVFDFTESYDVAQYLRAHTDTADRIQVWGYEPLVYYLADRDEASRFQITHPLVMRVPGQPLSAMQTRWRAEFMRDVTDRKPQYVAVVQHDNWWWAPDQRTSEQLLDDFPEWKQYVATHYELERTMGRFLVYRRIGGTVSK